MTQQINQIKLGQAESYLDIAETMMISIFKSSAYQSYLEIAQKAFKSFNESGADEIKCSMHLSPYNLRFAPELMEMKLKIKESKNSM